MIKLLSSAPRVITFNSPTLETLLSRGYFPRELPPPFSTSKFATYAVGHHAGWNKKTWTACASHNLARPGGLRRPLRVPNPISYVRLASLIVDEWKRLRTHTWKTRLSASRPQVLKNSKRAITSRYRYAEVPRLRALRRRGGRYLLCTDLNQFYPTIYTHSIAWALEGKLLCKANLAAKGPTLLGEAIDKALGTLNEGQTHGIPIGPDASLVAAEILLAAVDEQLIAKCGKAFKGFRYVDDYELACATLRDAEAVLTELQAILAEYELQPNPRKTEIRELPCALDDSWAHELSQFEIDASSPVKQRNGLIALFSRAFDIASKQPEKSVLRYAVGRLQGLKVAPAAWRSFENCLLASATADPATLPVVLGSLYAVSAASGRAVSKSPLASVLEPIVTTHAPRAHGSEVAWSLWAALAWKVPLDASVAKAVGEMEDDIVALLALELERLKLFPNGALDSSRWRASSSVHDALIGEHWLLAYEGHVQKFLSTPAIAAHPVFGAMSKAGISFFDRSQNTPQFPQAGRPIPGGLLDDNYA